MQLIVGLGNPGERYANTRHNVGWMAVDEILSQEARVESQDFSFQFSKKHEAEIAKTGNLILAKPQTYMNESGRAVRKILEYYSDSGFRIQDLRSLYVIHDDLDIEMGKYKIEFGHGPKIHGGVNSTEQHLGTKNFWRVRVGVDNRTAEERSKIQGREYVLMKLQREEQEVLEKVCYQLVDNLITRIG